jgi:tRNA(fMet)-specific endonuclease VapC
MTKRYILDSNAVSDLTHDRRGVWQKALLAKARGAKLGTCPPVIGELLAGIEGSQSKERNLSEIKLSLRGLTIWPYHTAEAFRFGQLHAQLKRIGRPMQVVDMQLASVAFVLGQCTVVSSDTDLLAIPGLQVEDWTA